MKNVITDLLVRPGADIDLKRAPTLSAPLYDSKRAYRQLLEEHVARLTKLHQTCDVRRQPSGM